MGATDPKNADNVRRKLYGLSIDKNSVHGIHWKMQKKK